MWYKNEKNRRGNFHVAVVIQNEDNTDCEINAIILHEEITPKRQLHKPTNSANTNPCVQATSLP